MMSNAARASLLDRASALAGAYQRRRISACCIAGRVVIPATIVRGRGPHVIDEITDRGCEKLR
jgi:hypothetical protein